MAEKPEDGEKGSYESPLTLEASPTDADMAVPGYKFLGWISTAEVKKDSAVWKYIYDVANDPYVTSDPERRRHTWRPTRPRLPSGRMPIPYT